MGVLVDFEYKMWRSNHDGNHGADGLSVFLFDATEEFRLGGYGGSLGYAPNTNSTPPVTEGLAGGYVGVGLDAYGNFSNPTEGRVGEVGGGERPNAVVLRGPTTNAPTTTNRFLASELLPPRGGGNNTIRQQNQIDYNTTTAQRPSSDEFYRRVQITILPVKDENNNTKYEIAVRWSKTPGGTFEDLITYTTEDPPPALMKVGFAASTGASFNYHEIRNILVTTLGNLRTTKLADRDYLIPDDAGGVNQKEITYTIEVVNDTDTLLENIVLVDTLKDGNGNVLSPGTFQITGITVLDTDVLKQLLGHEIQQGSTPNTIEGIVSIDSNSTGRIRVTGILHQTPPGNAIINTVILYPPEGTDQDLLNNVSSVRTPVYAQGVDLIVGDIIVDKTCIDFVDGNTFTVRVSNLGTRDLNINGTNNITVTITHPPGITFAPLHPSPIRWTLVSNSPTNHTFELTNSSITTLLSGFTHPDAIRFRLTPELTDIPTRSVYTVTTVISQVDDEDDDNQDNNTSEATVRNCAVVSNPMIRHRVKW